MERRRYEDVPVITRARAGLRATQRVRMRRYAWVMGTCLTLWLLAIFVVRLYSIPAAVVMCAVACVLPPIAAVVANAGSSGG
ncbi:DUF3099 domain-containing protein [Nocardioides acrostichi]|nr:DUF3099 domain-containing protein [Nocardioides acrostichi]